MTEHAPEHHEHSGESFVQVDQSPGSLLTGGAKGIINTMLLYQSAFSAVVIAIGVGGGIAGAVSGFENGKGIFHEAVRYAEGAYNMASVGGLGLILGSGTGHVLNGGFKGYGKTRAGVVGTFNAAARAYTRVRNAAVRIATFDFRGQRQPAVPYQITMQPPDSYQIGVLPYFGGVIGTVVGIYAGIHEGNPLTTTMKDLWKNVSHKLFSEQVVKPPAAKRASNIQTLPGRDYGIDFSNVPGLPEGIKVTLGQPQSNLG